MRGRTGVLHTGHWLVDERDGGGTGGTGGTGPRLRRARLTVVHFADLDDAEIDAYVATGEPLAVAGAFTVDGLGGAVRRPASRATTTASSGVSLPLLAAPAGQVGLRCPTSGRVAAGDDNAGRPLTGCGPIRRPADVIGRIPQNGPRRGWAHPANLRRVAACRARRPLTAGVTVSRARHHPRSSSPTAARSPSASPVACRDAGIASVAVYADPTASRCTSASPTRRSRWAVPAPRTRTSTPAKLLDVARRSGADAVHPGLRLPRPRTPTSPRRSSTPG